jgi:hypothetical protein
VRHHPDPLPPQRRGSPLGGRLDRPAAQRAGSPRRLASASPSAGAGHTHALSHASTVALFLDDWAGASSCTVQ